MCARLKYFRKSHAVTQRHLSVETRTGPLGTRPDKGLHQNASVIADAWILSPS
jgi:hypothetical protein